MIDPGPGRAAARGPPDLYHGCREQCETSNHGYFVAAFRCLGVLSQQTLGATPSVIANAKKAASMAAGGFCMQPVQFQTTASGKAKLGCLVGRSGSLPPRVKNVITAGGQAPRRQV